MPPNWLKHISVFKKAEKKEALFCNFSPQITTFALHMGTFYHAYNKILVLLLLSFCYLSANCKELEGCVSLMKKGSEYMTCQRYPEAIDCFVAGMKLAEKDKDLKTYYCSMANIGSVYGIIGNFPRSVYFLDKAYQGIETTRDSTLMSEMIINLVGSYCEMGNIEMARKFFSLQNRIPLRDKTMSHYYFLYNQALIAKLEKRFALAKYYHLEAANYAIMHHKPLLANTQYEELAKEYLSQKKYREALSWANQALRMANLNGNAVKRHDAAHILYEIYKEKGQSQTAEKYRNIYLGLEDSIFNKQQIEAAREKVMNYEELQSNQRISSLSTVVNKQYAMLIAISCVVLLLLVLLIIILTYSRRLRKAQRLLIAKNEELMRQQDRSGHLLKLSQDKKLDLQRRIDEVMSTPEIIKRSDFSLNMLSDMVGSNTKYCSMVINDVYGKSFKSLLNEYRVREACKLLKDVERSGSLTIQAIYQEVGYSSAGGFYEAFKKEMGMTPSVYLKLARSKG